MRQANRRYYEAFENRDMDAMSDLWEHNERVICTHPGWVPLRGWAEVAGGFYALFNSEQGLQFLLTEEHTTVAGSAAWVLVTENILGLQGGAAVSALNLFVEDGRGNWRMAAHQASLVSPPIEDQPA